MLCENGGNKMLLRKRNKISQALQKQHVRKNNIIKKYANILYNLKNHKDINLYDVITYNKNVRCIITTLRGPTHYTHCYYNGINMRLPVQSSD